MTETRYTALAKPFARQRGPRIVATLLAVFVAVAIIKPWPGAPGGHRGGTPGPSTGLSPIALASVTPTAETPSIGPNTMACLAGAQPQMLTVERAAGREIRSWIAIADEVHAEPVGLRQNPISIFSAHVIGLGVCGPDRAVGGPTGEPQSGEPHSGEPPTGEPRTADSSLAPVAPAPTARPDRQASTIVAVALLTGPNAANLVEYGVGPVLPGQTARVDTARLYGPPVANAPAPSGTSAAEQPPGSLSAPGAAGAWPVGSWAIGFRYAADAPGVVHWARVEILLGAGGSG